MSGRRFECFWTQWLSIDLPATIPEGRCEEADATQNPLTKTSTKRNKMGGQFMAVKKNAKKFKGVRKEK
ncbi:hypothetical protein NLM27_41300 [Bradyrhizobium sp. CCGB12]|uniref:hypothetical protein n=1 Tax=Bradyrhizobium sp. CCGB12 TaxID=2949632 RepID=UPI0020B386D5|nr:hypothetical protein [Bradyrhizobium sp. CCGB12]MCP3395183.1 hypothetical protein [Bradyrhizobium sp. CCGB12]